MANPSDEIDLRYSEWAECVRSFPEPPLAIEALWDSDELGWFLRVSVVMEPLGHGLFESQAIGVVRERELPPEVRQLGPLSESAVARAAGERLAAHCGAEFYFPSPADRDAGCPSWWERHRAVPCNTCGKPLRSDRFPSPEAARCSPCSERANERMAISGRSVASGGSLARIWVRRKPALARLTIQRATVAALALLGGFGPRCNPAASVANPVVATIGDEVITAADVSKKMATSIIENPTRLDSRPGRLEFVETMVKSAVLDREARKQGLDKTLDMRNELERFYGQELIRGFYDRPPGFSDEELESHYLRNSALFGKPQKIRVQYMFLDAPEVRSDARSGQQAGRRAHLIERFRAKERAKALYTLARVAQPLSGEPSPASNAGLLSRQWISAPEGVELADPESKDKAGDTGLASREELTRSYSAEFAQAAFALDPSHPLSGVIETPKGFHIALLLERQFAPYRELDDSGKQAVRNHLRAETLKRKFNDYYESLRMAAHVTVNQETLEAIQFPEPSREAVISYR
jgi:hypothetical protein